MTAQLRAADLRFINRIAARRFTGAEPGAAEESVLEAVLAEAVGATPFQRAGNLVAAILRRAAFADAPLQTALLTMHCALGLEGLSLLAPQGVVAGMMRDLAVGGDAATMARWLEDRAVPAAAR
jgi:prophage maintenance system killer protein